MIQTSVVIRNIGAVVLIVIGAVALGLSAHVRQSGKDVGYEPSAMIMNIVAGAWTLGTELIFALIRNVRPGHIVTAYVVELGVLLVTTTLWLVSGDLTSQARNICDQLDDLSSTAEYSNSSPDEISHAHEVLGDICSELQAAFGFIWLGFVAAILLLAFLGVQAFRMRRKGVSKIMLKPISTMGEGHVKGGTV